MSLINENSLKHKENLEKRKVNYKFEKEEEISFIISQNFKSDIVIIKGLFDAKTKNVDKLYSLENRDVFIFHLELSASVEYIDSSTSSGVKLIEKRLLTSKVMEIRPSCEDNINLKPVVSVSYGVISSFKDILYCTVLISLVLGGSNYAN